MFVVAGSHRSSRPLHTIVSVCLLLTIGGCGGGGAGGGSGPSTSNGSSANNPMPAITGLSPASAAAGAAAQTLTINGSGFTSNSTVTYNGAAHTASYVSSTQLTVQLSAADLGTAGSYAVIATNPAPGGGASNSIDFAVTVVNNLMPAITGLAPVSAVSGTAAQPLTINGSGFIKSSTVFPTASCCYGPLTSHTLFYRISATPPDRPIPGCLIQPPKPPRMSSSPRPAPTCFAPARPCFPMAVSSSTVAAAARRRLCINRRRIVGASAPK